MRLIDADALEEILTTAIRTMQGIAKFIGAEDDPEIKMEIKAYTDILNGVKEQPTIEPERKRGKWLWKMRDVYRCSVCETETHVDECMEDPIYNFCPFCGADMRGERDEQTD